jgi:hypothetical protein
MTSGPFFRPRRRLSRDFTAAISISWGMVPGRDRMTRLARSALRFFVSSYWEAKKAAGRTRRASD